MELYISSQGMQSLPYFFQMTANVANPNAADTISRISVFIVSYLN